MKLRVLIADDEPLARERLRFLLSAHEEIEVAGEVFRRKIERYAPRHVVFLGKMALSAISRRRDIHWGLQTEPFGGARAWVVPNPSGLNRSFDLDALVAAYREVRIAVASTP